MYLLEDEFYYYLPYYSDSVVNIEEERAEIRQKCESKSEDGVPRIRKNIIGL